MKKKAANLLMVIMLISGILIGMNTAAASDGRAPRPYQVNENGQTYGGLDPFSTIPQESPQLVAAIGLDGTEGYVYAEDLDGDQPKNPDEALVYMENLRQRAAEAARSNEEYSRYIPLYDSDGITVIGEFGISFPSF